ncbi:methylenetetrahydrofolate dehydrogenase [Mucor ambiguus]|uniref:Methylenetetrahydrofolate dehydrogenase n=1 Tax=Mucor ambiguus TaxID=91626 RepID=A0A0C9MVL0_9FUNG|nr:methylenetetrahydrofolate dehydrogenase [Mucor ambiguus]
MTNCKTILASKVASSFRNHIKKTISTRKIQPTLVGFLANEDPAAKKYAEWTAKSCNETGVRFNLVKVDKDALEQNIIDANLDKDVNGIMVYYPIFGNHLDLYLQNRVNPLKDVEGLGNVAVRNVYQYKQCMDDDASVKSIIPCTPLAIVKILEYINRYKADFHCGTRLKGQTITVINRSEIVGRPLAALLANEGATVYSVDQSNVQTFTELDSEGKCTAIDTNLKCLDVIPQSDIVITGVPTPNFKVPTKLLKPGVASINFSTFANFEPDVTSKASYFVPSVGKVTVAMLECNLLRLYDYQQRTMPL